jgi:hypothetical protein
MDPSGWEGRAVRAGTEVSVDDQVHAQELGDAQQLRGTFCHAREVAERLLVTYEPGRAQLQLAPLELQARAAGCEDVLDPVGA